MAQDFSTTHEPPPAPLCATQHGSWQSIRIFNICAPQHSSANSKLSAAADPKLSESLEKTSKKQFFSKFGGKKRFTHRNKKFIVVFYNPLPKIVTPLSLTSLPGRTLNP
ncbi:MAG: hypothetical protein B7Z77_09085 [Acidocella sp. 20-58-15]|nr:MAG: hypothetical protein B7Z77_09085 [Acidocella sp. 20-58-15]